MATSNLQQWNPAQVNQETDAQYTADSQRAGGATYGSPAPSPTLNKLFYQVSTFVAAFGQMMAGKGYSTSDADINVLATVLSNLVTEADLQPNLISVAYSPTPVYNAAAANGFQTTLTGNISALSITGVSPGQMVAFFFVQDGVGDRTVAWPGSVNTIRQPNPQPSSTSVFLFRADLAGSLWPIGYPVRVSNDVTDSRALNTPVQNLTGFDMDVEVIALAGGSLGGTFYGSVGPNTGALSIVAAQSAVFATTGSAISIRLTVPAGSWYSLSRDINLTLDKVTEYTFQL